MRTAVPFEALRTRTPSTARRGEAEGDRADLGRAVAVRRQHARGGLEAGDRQRRRPGHGECRRAHGVSGADRVGVEGDRDGARVPGPVDGGPAPASLGHDRVGSVLDLDRPRPRGGEPRREPHGAADSAFGLGAPELGQADARHPPGDRREQAVDRAARAAREAGVTVPRNGAKPDMRAGVPFRAAGRHSRVLTARVDVADVEPPRQQVLQRRPRRRRDRRRVVDADDRDADAARVEAPGVGADHVLRDAPAAAFEDAAVLVDEEVVADVVPPVAEHVVALDAADDRRGLRGRVAVRPGGVVDDREAEAGGDRGRPPDDRLVGAPAGAAHDRRRGERRGGGGRPSPLSWA